MLAAISTAFSAAKTYIFVIIGVAVITIVGLLYWQHLSDQKTIMTQAANVATLTDATKTQQNTIDALGADLKIANAVTNQAQAQAQSARKTLDNTRTQIQNLQKQLAVNPQKTETDANTAMNKSILCISIATGATATDLNLDAKGYTDAKNSCN